MDDTEKSRNSQSTPTAPRRDKLSRMTSHVVIIKGIEIGRWLPWRFGTPPWSSAWRGRRLFRPLDHELAPGQLLQQREREGPACDSRAKIKMFEPIEGAGQALH